MSNRLTDEPEPKLAPPAADSSHAVPTAPALITEPTMRRGASDKPRTIGSAASTIECPGIRSDSFTYATAAAAAAPHASRRISSIAEIRFPVRDSVGKRAASIRPS
jgi:hypothetical protein